MTTIGQDVPTFSHVAELIGDVENHSEHTFTDHVGIAVDCKVVSVDDVNQHFDASLNIHIHYRLPQYVYESGEYRYLIGPDEQAEDIFVVVDKKQFRMFFVPEVTSSYRSLTHKFDDFYTTIRVNRKSGDIWVQYENFCTMFEDLELRTFPYDRQVFRVNLSTPGVNVVPWHLKINKVEYAIPKLPGAGTETDMLLFQASNWICKGKKLELSGKLPVLLSGIDYAEEIVEQELKKKHDVRVTFLCDRDQSYYQSNYILISAFLAFGTSSIFLIPVTNVEDRQALIITILLAMVALKFALSANTPVLGYNTYLDMFLLMWNTILFLAIVWNFLAASIVFFSCDNDLADFDCLADQVQRFRDIEAYVSIVFVVVWLIIISGVYILGYYKDDYETVMSNQTEAINLRELSPSISMRTNKK